MSKIIVLLIIVAAVWYGFKVFTRGGSKVTEEKEAGRLRKGNDDESRDTVQDMETCSICGTFVPVAAARNCGRDGCPYQN